MSNTFENIIGLFLIAMVIMYLMSTQVKKEKKHFRVEGYEKVADFGYKQNNRKIDWTNERR